MAQQPPPPPSSAATSSSLPTLTAFLRAGGAARDPSSSSANSPNDDRRHVEKRRLDHTAPPPPPPPTSSAMMHDAHRYNVDHHHNNNGPLSSYPRSKRRANVFTQYNDSYADGGYGNHPPMRPLHHQQEYYDRPPPPRMPMYAPPPPSVPHDAVRVPPVSSSSSSSMQDPPGPNQRERTSRYLSEADRRAIILRIDNGEKQVALAKEYLVSRAAICNLYKNREEVLTRVHRNPAAKHPKRHKEKPVPGTTSSPANGTPETVPVESPSEEKETMSDSGGGADGGADDDAMSDEHSSTESDVGTNKATTNSEHTRPHPVNTAASRAHSQQPTNQQPTSNNQRVYDCSANSHPIRRLVTMLRNPMLPLAMYRRLHSRLVTAIMEEAVACLPQQHVTLASTNVPSVLPVDDTSVCGISIEDQGTPMLQAFTDIFPGATTGTVSLYPRHEAMNSWVVERSHLPPVYQDRFILLLASSCGNGARVSAALDHLVGYAHINPASIYVVTAVSARAGIARVHAKFPGVTVISGAVDEHVDAHGLVEPGIGDVVTRSHWEIGTTRSSAPVQR